MKASILVLALFCSFLLAALALDISLLWALAAGYGLFFVHALKEGVPARRLVSVSLSGMRTVSPILAVFVIIGMLTASWRASGTIACLVSMSLGVMEPEFFLPCSFLLNCALSWLLGSSFATAATLGVITMSLGNALHVPAVLCAGSILAGIYFGDRGSPMSTSALLVATVTKTRVYDNVCLMMRTSWPAFAASIVLYAALSLLLRPEGSIPNVQGLFAAEFSLTPLLALPALLLLALAFMRVRVHLAMLASTVLALAFCLFLQDTQPSALPSLLIHGFAAQDPNVARILNGGGVLSMAEVAGIVCISSTYAGIFREGGLLRVLTPLVHLIAKRWNDYAPSLVVGFLTACISCNQTLPIMLTQQITASLTLPPSRQAIDLEDSAVLVPALIPWSIACAIPLQMLEAPDASVALAFYLWLLPLSRLFITPRARCSK